MRIVLVGTVGKGGDEAARRWWTEALPGATVVEPPPDAASFGPCDAVVVLDERPPGSPIVSAVKAFADRGGAVLGVQRGFRLLTGIGLLDGLLVDTGEALPEGREVHLVVEGRPTPFTFAIPAGRVLRMPWDGSAGRYQHPDPASLEREARVVLRYADASGGRSDGSNPLGVTSAIAGITNAAGNIVGASPGAIGSGGSASPAAGGAHDGRLLLASLALHVAGRGGRV